MDWPDKPHRAEPVCDRCDRDAALGSALCHGCMDAEYWARRNAMEDRDE